MGKHRWPTAGDSTPLGAPPHPGQSPHLGPPARVVSASRVESGARGGVGGPSPRAQSSRYADAEEDADARDRFGEWFEEDGRGSRPPVQWRVARSAALVFLGVALAVGGALFLVRSSEPSAAAVSVQLDPEEPGSPSGQEGSGGEGEQDDGAMGPGDPADPGAAAGQEIGGTPAATSPGGAVAPTTPGPGGAGDEGSLLSVFYVTGAVASPGVVTAPPGTRLFELIEQVGGPTPEADLEGINLAATPADGAHIHLLAVGEEPRADAGTVPGGSGNPADGAPGGTAGASAGAQSSADGAAGPAAGGGTGLIDLNAASLTELQTLPRVGPVLGQRILDWRTQNGPFTQPADLDAVPGIGPAMLEGILPLVVVR